LVKKGEGFGQKRGRFKNPENQNYNFPRKKEECVTWHLRNF
jgi:hypothetical protein